MQVKFAMHKLHKLIKYLLKNHKTIATAESVTGGLVAKTFTDVPGSSYWYSSGVVSYSDEIKHKMLGVKTETLEKYGAVSKECAKEMAEGVIDAIGADMSIATTGYAGPTGEDVGTVFIAFCTLDGGKKVTDVEEMHYPKTLSREQIREKVTDDAISIAVKKIGIADVKIQRCQHD